LTNTHRKSSARRDFFEQLRRAPILFAENPDTLSRAHVHTPLGRAHSNHAIIGVKGALGPIDKNHQSPLTPRISRFAWVVVLAPNRGCGREDRERRKAEEGERKGRGAGCNFHTKPNEGNRTQTQGEMVETGLFKIDINSNKIIYLCLTG
jgi:hypothetical protein